MERTPQRIGIGRRDNGHRLAAHTKSGLSLYDGGRVDDPIFQCASEQHLLDLKLRNSNLDAESFRSTSCGVEGGSLNRSHASFPTKNVTTRRLQGRDLAKSFGFT
jgi:hypothetical protein